MVVKTATFLELPNEEDVIAMRKEVGITPSSLKEDVQILKTWLEQQPHLPSNIDETRLEKYLFYCKNSIEKSKMKIEQYYSLKTAAPEVFLDRDPSDEKIWEQSKILTYNPLPRLTPGCERAIVFKIFNPNATNASTDENIKRIFMVYDWRLAVDHSSAEIIMYDLSNINMNIFKQISFSAIKKVFTYGNMAYPYRIKHIVLYKAPGFVESFINLCKGIISKKLASKVTATSTLEELHKYVPKHVLPKEYGGDEPRTMEQIRDEMDAELKKNKAFFEAEKKFKSDESKRIGKSTVGEVTEMQGSFRKICID